VHFFQVLRLTLHYYYKLFRYDDHREAILAGWSASGGDSPDDMNMLFDMVPFMHPGCYSGYHNENGGFYEVYKNVFEHIVACERGQSEKTVELPTDFGDTDSEWSHVGMFYQVWESFSSSLNFAWEDKYNAHEDGPSRRVRRMMEEENKKARRAAKKTYNQDIWALVYFVKRRDPRVEAKQEEMERQKVEQQRRQREEVAERKKQQKKAKEAWREEGRRAMEEAEEVDRLAGRVRLADLEDDYDYGGGKKKRGKGKKNHRQGYEKDEEENQAEAPVNPEESEGVEVKSDDQGDLLESEGAEVKSDDQGDLLEEGTEPSPGESDAVEQEGGGFANGPDIDVQEEEMLMEEDEFTESEEEPDVWRCECCQKFFKSESQMQNHMKSKKHKEAFKKYQAMLKMIQAEAPVNPEESEGAELKSEDQGDILEEGTQTSPGEPDAVEQGGGGFANGPDNDVLEEEMLMEEDDFTESEEEPDVWRCECCRKDFKSEGQMLNHMKSKKHKEAFKKYQAKEELMAGMMDDSAMGQRIYH
jgi:DnaJ family protein A protein 5